jgi:hypothetical protein
LNPDNEKHSEYREQMNQLMLFNENSEKYNLLTKTIKKVQMESAV